MASALAPISSTPYRVEHAPLVERHGQVEGGLAAQGGQQGVGPLALDDRGEHLGVERLDVGGVGEVGVGHDRRRVGVDQDDPVALLAQHPAGLGARVVELARLADDDRARPDDAGSMRRSSAAGHQRRTLRAAIRSTELVEEVAGVVRARARPRGGTAR